MAREAAQASGTRPAGGLPKSVNLALQGGGAHGAFTWGVLDRLLEEERLALDGISATSAGAVNAAVLVYGLAVGGREGARQALGSFWRRIAEAALFSPLQPSFWDRFTRNYRLEASPAHLFFDMLSRMLSPYQSNPLNYNPMKQVLESVVDFARLRQEGTTKLFLSATNVRTGKAKIFSRDEITADAVLASACLPLLFQAVEIDGEAYWDGGYMGNPALFPLIYECISQDIVVVHLDPIVRPVVPKTARDILDRVNEISFNSSLMREMRAVAFVNKLVQEHKISDTASKPVRIHAIDAEDIMQTLSAASKLNADWDFLLALFEIGRQRASGWLERNWDQVGTASTVDLQERYL